MPAIGERDHATILARWLIPHGRVAVTMPAQANLELEPRCEVATVKVRSSEKAGSDGGTSDPAVRVTGTASALAGSTLADLSYQTFKINSERCNSA